MCKYRPASVLFALLTLVPACQGPGGSDLFGPYLPELDRFIETQMASGHFPAMSTAILRNGKVVWSNSFGYADLRTKSPMTSETGVAIGSITKIFTGAALMQLVERGKLKLDTDINSYLPFAVSHPFVKGSAITARMLLTHTSSIRNFTAFPEESVGTNADSPYSLAQFVQSWAIPGRPFYDAEKIFSHAPPGSQYEYSNIAISLAGYLVETITGQTYDAYVRENIFDRLGMAFASARLSDFNPATLSTPYSWNQSSGKYDALPHMGRPDVPAANIRTNLRDLAKFLGALMAGKAGPQILSAASLNEMRRPQIPDIEASQSLALYYQTVGSHRILGHGGALFGNYSYLGFVPSTGLGIIILSNGDYQEGVDDLTGTFGAIENRLLKVGETIDE
jgi:CubicO group peptidase (beta-lactamase class C family)